MNPKKGGQHTTNAIDFENGRFLKKEGGLPNCSTFKVKRGACKHVGGSCVLGTCFVWQGVVNQGNPVR